ncbi:MAG: DnaD domain-containing protein [Anaerolineae bacterium]
MDAFRGFGGGRVPLVPLPEQFFRELLPRLDDLAELKVTLYCFWLLSRKKGEHRFLTRRELEEDQILRDALQTDLESGEQALWAGLERAVARGTLLRLVGRAAGQETDCFVLNTERGRELVRRVQEGRVVLDVPEVPHGDWVPERPNIFALYEQNIGLLQPLLVEELREAEETYPPEWIEEAFRLAVRRNARNWSYVRAILERWAREGKDEGGNPEP